MAVKPDARMTCLVVYTRHDPLSVTVQRKYYYAVKGDNNCKLVLHAMRCVFWSMRGTSK